MTVLPRYASAVSFILVRIIAEISSGEKSLTSGLAPLEAAVSMRT